MKFLRSLIIFTFLLIIHFTSFSQSERPKIEGSLDEGTIESQYNYLYKKSGRYQEYRVIKITEIGKFKKNVIDSLKLGRKKLIAEKKIVATQKSEIESLKKELGSTNDNLTSVTKEKDSINLFGMQLSKAGYNTFLWSIITALGALLAFFIIKFKRSNVITVQVKKDKGEIEGEYDDYRRKTIEREQKLRRELQDELNKQKYSDSSQKRK